MKRIIVIGIVIWLVLALSVGAFAFENEPDGFRGLKWGDPPSKEMEYLDDIGGLKNYTLPDDKMSIGSAKFYLIVYGFYEGRFFGITLYFRGENNYDLLETICKERYGSEKLEEGFYALDWTGQKSFITLRYNIVKETGFLLLNGTVIVLEKSAAEKKKEAEKAEGDW